MAGVEDMDEFDAPRDMAAAYCTQITEEEYENQTVSETEKALENLIAFMEKNPDVYKNVLKKKIKREKPLSFLKVKVLTLIKGEENVALLSDKECQRKMQELTSGMTRAFDYNLESKGRRQSKRLAEKQQLSNSSSSTASPKAKGRQPKRGSSSKYDKKTTACQGTSGEIVCPPVTIPPPPPPPPPPPVTPAPRKSQSTRPCAEKRDSHGTPLKELNVQVNTPLSLKNKESLNEMGSTTSLASIGSLSSLHQELLSYNPQKRLKATSKERSPGGTPVKPRPPIKKSPPPTPATPAESIYRYWLNSLHSKFRNVLSPGSGPQSPVSDPSSPDGFSPH